MRTVIINGSPKGDFSITLHTCLYLQQEFPQHEFEIFGKLQ